MAAPQWNMDNRARAWQTFSQPLSATGDDARRSSMHTPAPSRCVFHCTDGRRPGRIKYVCYVFSGRTLCANPPPLGGGAVPPARDPQSEEGTAV